MSILLANAMSMSLREDHSIFKAVVPLESCKVETSTLCVLKLYSCLSAV